MLHHLDLGDRRAVHRERSFHADALAELADRERFPHAAAAHVDHLAAELLLALLVALDHPHRHLHRVAGAQVGTVRPDAGGLDFFDQAHWWAPFCAECRTTGPRDSRLDARLGTARLERRGIIGDGTTGDQRDPAQAARDLCRARAAAGRPDCARQRVSRTGSHVYASAALAAHGGVAPPRRIFRYDFVVAPCPGPRLLTEDVHMTSGTEH